MRVVATIRRRNDDGRKKKNRADQNSRLFTRALRISFYVAFIIIIIGTPDNGGERERQQTCKALRKLFSTLPREPIATMSL